jgi:hypothetical protein
MDGIRIKNKGEKIAVNIEPPAQSAANGEPRFEREARLGRRFERENEMVERSDVSYFANSDSVQWQAEEYEHKERDKNWYWGLGIIILALIITAFLFKNFLLGAFFLLAGFSLALLATKRPDLISFSLNSKGIQIDKKIFYYEVIDSFWILYDPPHRKEIIVKSGKLLMPHIIIPLGDVDPDEVRNYLLQFLEEEKMDDTLLRAIVRAIGF